MKSTGNKKVWTTTTTKKVETKTVAGGLNKLLWLAVIVVGAIVVFASMYFPIFKNSSPLMAAFIIVGIVVMLAIARFTNQGAKGWQFVLDARLEMRKVVWPTRQETINSTLIVLAIVIVASLIIYFVGLLFMHLIQWILS
ncbi:preprotein translocase subunit SecE [Fangia hongkongensis]|uniref:preprotein translocase subunit SecE n=1 Tax=Fangia hongkongensis TaxID=270495 RepID=UPI00037A48A2|nr:preprotein translocase subunit SecE [Fangia hongkongensis]MBK2125566.1 preprotein translocase subunit SecE [Fangia hongkongensis]